MLVTESILMNALLPITTSRPLPDWLLGRMKVNAKRMMRLTAALWAPPPRMGTQEWADARRYLSPKASARPGRYRSSVTPYIAGILAAMDDPDLHEVVCMKSAQVAWTEAVNNYLGRRIDIDPVPILVMFPSASAAKQYSETKFRPMVEATAVLNAKVDLSGSRKIGNRWDYWNFPGGFLSLFGSNSTVGVKSTPAPVVIIEEPADANLDLKGQGNSINLLRERTKTYHNWKVIQGGTPSVKGLCPVESAWDRSDKRRFEVPCADCGEYHVLAWANMSWDEDARRRHTVYGDAVPESARYICPHCGGVWDDHSKNRAVRDGRWVASLPFQGVAGFHINELYSPFPGSTFESLARRYLVAKADADRGDTAALVVFTNSTLGLPFEFSTTAPDADRLRARAMDYPALTVPEGGLLLTAGVDVQRDRLAVIIRAWGRGEESWLVWWGELHAARATTDITDPVWAELENRLFTPLPHARGMMMSISAISIDSGDGGSTDAVYHWVRTRQRRGVMAIKGQAYGAPREIFSAGGKTVDARNLSKADKFGVKVYLVGVDKAKDLLLADRGRLHLEGAGPGRVHWYDGVRPDYWEQLLSEVKAPHRSQRGKWVWQLRTGVRNEALDCEIYALHAARSRKSHLMTPGQWDALERHLSQGDLLMSNPTTTAAPIGVTGTIDLSKLGR